MYLINGVHVTGQLDLFHPDSAGFILCRQGYRVKGRIGKPVGATLAKMEGHPHHALRHLAGYPGFDLYPSSTRFDSHHFTISDTHRSCIGWRNVGGLLAQKII